MEPIVPILVLALKGLEQATKDVISSQQIHKAGDTIQACAVMAAVAGVGAGWLPGAGAFVASAAWVAAIWGMYIKVNKDLGISIKGNVLKSLASAILTNIIASAGALLLGFGASVVLSFIPVANIAAMAIDGLIGYVTVFASGVLYIKLLTKLFKAGKGFNIAESEVKGFADEITKENNVKEILKEAKKAYDKDKKAGKFNKTDGK